MPVSLADLPAPRRPEPPRDRWERYQAVDAFGNPKAYRRATSVAKKIGNTFGLESWQQGQVACGMGQRPTLVKLAQANPDWYAARSIYKEIVEAAFEASGANEGRRLGTALHALTQELDEGRLTPERMQDIAEVDPDDLLRLDAYQQALADAGIKVDTQHIEQVLLMDSPAIAGTADRFGWLPDGRYVVLDLKTGKLDFGEVEWAAQLSMYANHDATWNYVGQKDDDDVWERGPKLQGIDTSTAIIIHLPAQGEVSCTIWELDLELGYSALIYASYVLDFGNMKAMRPYGSSAELKPQSALVGAPAEPGAVRAWLADRIVAVNASLTTVDHLNGGPMRAIEYLMAKWPGTVPRPLPDDLAEYQIIDLDRILSLTETTYQLPWPPARPGLTVADIKQKVQEPAKAPTPPKPKAPAAKKAVARKAAAPRKKTNTTTKEK